MIVYIFEKEEPNRYIVVKNRQQATFSLECFKEYMELWLNRLKDKKNKVKKKWLIIVLSAIKK